MDAKVVKGGKTLCRSTRKAVARGVDVVVAVGGDGTVVRVASHLAETHVELGVVPLGTNNLLAGNLGIPPDVAMAVRVLVRRETRRIDLGRVTLDEGTFTFAVACAVGFDADVMEATWTGQRRQWGRLAYLGIDNVDCELRLDDVRTATPAAQVFVANFGRTLSGKKPRLLIDPADGLLDVVLVEASGARADALPGWEALRYQDFGTSRSGRAFHSRAREVRIETRPRRSVEVDGNLVGRTPVSITVLPGAVSVIAPPG